MGYITSLAVGNDRNWIVAGSNRGKAFNLFPLSV